MNFEVILHGKPNAGCHNATQGLDVTFCQNLVDKFFQSMGSIKDTEVLIVDTRNWKGTWYCIYTLWLGGNISDTADRESFLAISIVVPKQYYCLVSAVYDMLIKACQKSIVGIYISNKGKYIVPDFSDSSTFESLVKSINSYFVNLSENFDESFKQITENTTIKTYSLLDCDSKAFIEDLKINGRIFVSKSYESKDNRLSNTDKIHRELQSVKSDLETKTTKITMLTNQVKELEEQLNSKDSKASKTLSSLRKQLDDLTKEKSSLEKTITELSQKIDKYKENETKIVQLLSPKIPEAVSPRHLEDTNSRQSIKLKSILPFVNTLLLILLFVISGLKSCESQIQEFTGSEQKHNDEELMHKIDELQEIIKQKDIQIKTLTSSSSGSGASRGGTTIDYEFDVDCGLQCYQNSKPVNPSDIDPTKPLTILVKREEAGYAFHTDNLNADVQSGVQFNLIKKNPSKPITIIYRSADRAKRNEVNSIVIN